ncbi:hypothetical protein PaeBR_05120 [Paenibacillus sp. BR2-3]|uniref:hypothetical protein n=1 Tax=Paenibacillus sp. BR2-3 TaxID=3048494 RepID=UPI0039772D09
MGSTQKESEPSLYSGGKEKIGYAAIERLEVKEEYSDEKDAVFFNGTLESAVAVSSGDILKIKI